MEFDDFKVTQTKTNVIQYNACLPKLLRRLEFYNHGSQTVNSWTRPNTTGNNFLANGGTELNATSQLYDLDYRNYDPILGRMNGVDPMASKYASHTPYNFAFNSPTMLNDPSGADPTIRDNYAYEEYSQRQSSSHLGNPYMGETNLNDVFRGGSETSMFTSGWSVGSNSLSYGSVGGMTGSQAAHNDEFWDNIESLANSADANGETEVYGYSGKDNTYGYWLHTAMVGAGGIGNMGGARMLSNVEILWKLVEYKPIQQQTERGNSFQTGGDNPNSSAHYGFGFQLSAGLGLTKGTELSIGAWSGGPGSRGQFFFSIGTATKPIYLNAGGSAQFELLRSRSGPIDVSGKGKSWSGGFGPASGAYSQGFNNNGKVSVDVIGGGVGGGFPASIGVGVQTKTWTIDFLSPILITPLLGFGK